MAKEGSDNFPRNALEQAQMVYEGWVTFQDKMNVPNLSLEDFQKKMELAKEKVQLAEKLREERSKVIKVRNKALEEVWDLTKRVRNSAKATFGDDSKEIEKFGGKPVRLRRRRSEEM